MNENRSTIYFIVKIRSFLRKQEEKASVIARAILTSLSVAGQAIK